MLTRATSWAHCSLAPFTRRSLGLPTLRSAPVCAGPPLGDPLPSCLARSTLTQHSVDITHFPTPMLGAVDPLGAAYQLTSTPSPHPLHLNTLHFALGRGTLTFLLLRHTHTRNIDLNLRGTPAGGRPSLPFTPAPLYCRWTSCCIFSSALLLGLQEEEDLLLLFVHLAFHPPPALSRAFADLQLYYGTPLVAACVSLNLTGRGGRLPTW